MKLLCGCCRCCVCCFWILREKTHSFICKLLLSSVVVTTPREIKRRLCAYWRMDDDLWNLRGLLLHPLLLQELLL